MTVRKLRSTPWRQLLVPRGPGANLSDGLTGTSDIPGLYGRPTTILILAGAPQGHPDLSGPLGDASGRVPPSGKASTAFGPRLIAEWPREGVATHLARAI